MKMEDEISGRNDCTGRIYIFWPDDVLRWQAVKRCGHKMARFLNILNQNFDKRDVLLQYMQR